MKEITNKRNTRKIVRWRDSRMYIQQESMIDFEICIIDSIGFVVKETKDILVLAGDLVDDEFRRVIVIPKENIIESFSSVFQKQ